MAGSRNDGAFVSDRDRRLAKPDFERRAAMGASALRALGIDEDVPVALILQNDLSHLEVMRAAALSGAVVVAVNWHAEAEEVAGILEDSAPELVVIHRHLLKRLQPALAGRRVVCIRPEAALRTAYGIGDADAAAGSGHPEWADLVEVQVPLAQRAPMRPFLRYTSGSTGRPKGVRRLQTGVSRDFEDVLRRVATEMMRLRPGARYMTAAPLYHSAPSTLTSAALVAEGMSTFVLPKFEPEAFLATIEAERITHLYLVPTMMHRLLALPEELRARYDLSSVEYCVSTGSPWPQDLKRSMIDWWGPVFWESYGATEIGFITLVSSEEALARPGTAGRPQLGGSIMILDDQGNRAPSGHVGEIFVRLDAFGGFDYSNDPTGRAALEVDGHYSVGDLGWLDEDGYLFITDRKKDMIISGGANIFPAEIESVLLRAPFVYDVAVFGAPDPEFGEQIVAAIQPAAGWTPNEPEVRAFLDGRLARFKHPRIIAFHDSLPREDSGKIFKPRLREPYWQGHTRRV
ncbi:AMP-binding protein [Rhodobacterales bacterium HKCCE3408]|nr:AMP-binding protein [Rhodobacterales bacterium HKCCE3408]